MKVSFDKEGIETSASVKRRISKMFGFKQSDIVLCEASYSEGECTDADFCVCGVGYTVDLTTAGCIWFAPVWNNCM